MNSSINLNQNGGNCVEIVAHWMQTTAEQEIGSILQLVDDTSFFPRVPVRDDHAFILVLIGFYHTSGCRDLKSDK